MEQSDNSFEQGGTRWGKRATEVPDTPVAAHRSVTPPPTPDPPLPPIGPPPSPADTLPPMPPAIPETARVTNPPPASIPVYGTPAPVQPEGPSPWDLAPLAPPTAQQAHTDTIAQPVISDTYGDTGIPYVPAKRSRANGRFAWIAAVVGALALLVGGGFLALTALGADGGADSPEEAVDQLIAAVNAEDFLTLAELLEPAERRTMVEPTIERVLPELIRLGVLDEGIDLSAVGGIDLELTDVEYRIDEVGGAADMRHVFFTGGTASSAATADEFPFGDAIRARYGDDLQDAPLTTQAIEETEPPVVLVERNNRWYVSLWFTLGEAARREAGAELPSEIEQPFPLGSATPEEAVEQFIREIADFDLEGLIGRMDPEETAALYRYAPIFLDEAQTALDDAEQSLRESDVRWSVRDFRFDVARDGDDATVELRGVALEVSTAEVDFRLEYGRTRIAATLDGLIDGDRISGSLELTPDMWSIEGAFRDDRFNATVTIDRSARSVQLAGTANGDPFNGSLVLDDQGRCSEYRFDGFDSNEQGCLEELLDDSGVASGGIMNQLADSFDQIPSQFGAPSMAVHETNGKWYVSPTSTIMNGIVSGLQDVDQDSFDRFLDGLEVTSGLAELQGAMEAPFSLVDELQGGGFVGDGFVTDGGTGFTDGPLSTAEFRITPALGEITSYTDFLGEGRSRHEYLLDLEAGQVVGVTVYGDTRDAGAITDPVLTVQDPGRFEVAFNDDYDGLNSGLQFTAETTGAHRLLVEDLQSFGGQYEITIQIVGPGEIPSVADGESVFGDAPTVPGDIEPESVEFLDVTPGTPVVVADAVTLGSYDVWGLEGLSVGQSLTISVEAGGSPLDPEIVLIDGRTGDVLARNDDAPASAGLGPIDSWIEVVANSSETHFLEVHSFGDFGEGAYTLTITAN